MYMIQQSIRYVHDFMYIELIECSSNKVCKFLIKLQVKNNLQPHPSN